MFGIKKSHPFKQAIQNEGDAFTRAAHDMLDLSRRIQHAAGLSDKEIVKAEGHGLRFDVGDYRIEASHGIPLDSWVTFLMVMPKTSDGPCESFPDGWRYYARGTRTVSAPPDEIADTIVEAVKAL